MLFLTLNFSKGLLVWVGIMIGIVQIPFVDWTIDNWPQKVDKFQNTVFVLDTGLSMIGRIYYYNIFHIKSKLLDKKGNHKMKDSHDNMTKNSYIWNVSDYQINICVDISLVIQKISLTKIHLLFVNRKHKLTRYMYFDYRWN